MSYVLAGLALERIVGESYRSYVTREIFERAGMTEAGFFDRRDSVPRVAEGWDLVDGTWRSNIFSYPPIGSPDGGAHASAKDLLIFLDAVRSGQLLTPKLTEEFLTPQVARDEQVRFWFRSGVPPIDAVQGGQQRRRQCPTHPVRQRRRRCRRAVQCRGCRVAGDGRAQPTLRVLRGLPQPARGRLSSSPSGLRCQWP